VGAVEGVGEGVGEYGGGAEDDEGWLDEPIQTIVFSTRIQIKMGCISSLDAPFMNELMDCKNDFGIGTWRMWTGLPDPLEEDPEVEEPEKEEEKEGKLRGILGVGVERRKRCVTSAFRFSYIFEIKKLVLVMSG
jgi:hypothetical protein